MTRFFKYEGTGNDFIIIDDREEKLHLSESTIARLCHRRFGIGADGLILLRNERDFDFRMVYFNSDGRESSMCGNGGRCIAAFAQQIFPGKEHFKFLAIDGPHEADVRKTNEFKTYVSLLMKPVNEYKLQGNNFIIDTGSPHFVTFTNNSDSLDVKTEGRKIRNSPAFVSGGINVNFAEETESGLKVRTYERGVEDETYSCGTGVTACSIAYALKNNIGDGEVEIFTPGGTLKVKFNRNNNNFNNIILSGITTHIFTGSLTDGQLN